MFNAALNAVSRVFGTSRPAADTSNSSVIFSNRRTVSNEAEGARILHRLAPGDRAYVLHFVQDYLEQRGLENGLLNNITRRHELTYSELSDAVKTYFNTASVISFDKANQLLNAVLSADRVSASTILDTLTSTAKAYFGRVDAVVASNTTQALMQAFLRLKDTSLSGRFKQKTFKQSVGNALWDIYRSVRSNSTLSPTVNGLVINANLMFDRWRDSDFVDLKWMIRGYCSFHMADVERVKIIIDVIKCKSGDDRAKKLEAIFLNMAVGYFFGNASDAAVARLIIDAVGCLFEKGEIYQWDASCDEGRVVFCDLPEDIELRSALIACIHWFFDKEGDYTQHETLYYLPEEAGGRKTPRVLSELIGALWEKRDRSYNVVELAQSLYQKDSDARCQLCLIESLFLLSEQKFRHLPATINLPALIDDVFGFYSEKIKTRPEKIQSLLSLLSVEGYSDACRAYIKNRVKRFSSIITIPDSPIERQRVDNDQRLASKNRRYVFGVILEFLEQSSSGRAFLDRISIQSNFNYVELVVAAGIYFKTDGATLFDKVNQLLIAVLSAEGVSAGAALDALASAANAYFRGSVVTESVTQAFMQAFLYLKNTDISDECKQDSFKQAVDNALWDIYRAIRNDEHMSRAELWLVIDTCLQFNRWRGETSFIKLSSMAQDYCSINKPEPGRLAALLDVIKCDLSDNYQAKLQSIFIEVAIAYFTYNASDISVARLVIDAVAWLFEKGEMYDRDTYFSWNDTVFNTLPEHIEFQHTVSCCVHRFFYEAKDCEEEELTYYLPEEQDGRKSPRVLSELIAVLWKKDGGSYDIVGLAQSVYETNNDMRRQLCLVESLILLEDQKNRHLPAALDLPAIINSVFDINLTRLKSDPTGIQALLSLVASRGYSARCKSYLVNAIARQFAFFCGSEEAVSVSRIMTTYFSSGCCDAQLSDNFMLTMSHYSEQLAGQEAFSALVNNLEHYVLHEHINPEITKAVVRKLIEFRHVDYHEVIRQTLINLSEKDETGELGELVLSVLPDR